MTAATQTWYWLGALGMMIGALYFGLGAFSARKLNDDRAEVLYQLTFFISIIATVLYLALASGYGGIDDGEGPGTRTVWIRYVTWILSTPLLILVLTYLGRSRLTTTTALLGSNTLMIATGFLATIARDSSKYTFYVLSLGAFLAIIYLLVVPYRQEAKAAYPDKGGAFDRLVGVHVVLWALYPIVWILSPEGWGLYGSTMEASLFTILDILSKVGFGLLAVATLAQITGSKIANPANLGRPEGAH
ncbi:MAG: Bacteriorhodopsin-like protein [uncultured Truepera sp.]|uniref:Bacteriorhodopsin-like protein n=1 Tax=uncultured Truepera sp. TaxID=543023 RepID=A0A6J4UQD4_9DEIN|nr:MAG: Bacteriorhodopsin-like protein [uncultured Truepera sp.]